MRSGMFCKAPLKAATRALLPRSETGGLRATSCIFNEGSTAKYVIARLQSCNLNRRHWCSVGSSKGRDCYKIAYRATVRTAGGAMIVLNHSSCMTAWYIVMLEPAAGAGTRKQINSISIRVNYIM